MVLPSATSLPAELVARDQYSSMMSTPGGGRPGMGAQILLDHAATPSEVLRLIVFLMSDESCYSTGAEFVIDGGRVAGVPHA